MIESKTVSCLKQLSQLQYNYSNAVNQSLEDGLTMTHRSESTPLIKEEPIQSQKAMYDSVATYANNVLSENWAGNINAPDSDCTDSMREVKTSNTSKKIRKFILLNLDSTEAKYQRIHKGYTEIF